MTPSQMHGCTRNQTGQARCSILTPMWTATQHPRSLVKIGESSAQVRTPRANISISANGTISDPNPRSRANDDSRSGKW
jgi:hypothetical protein